MRYFSLLSLLCCVLLLTQCAKKTTDVVKQGEDIKTKVETYTKSADLPADFRSGAPDPGPAPKIQIGSYEQFELANGLKVIVVENHKIPRVSFSLTVDRDPIQEMEYAGYADIAGDLLSKGTTTRSKAQIDEEIDFMGASLSSSSTGMFAASLRKHTENLMGVMSDILLNPSFPEDEFEKSKKQTISGLAAAKEDPSAIAGNVSQVLRYGKKHPYGEVVTEETVEKITLGKCKSYYNTYFRPNISYLIVVGDITADEARPMVEKYFGGWQKATVPTYQYEKPSAPSATEIDFVNKAGAVQSVVRVTYPIDFKPGSADAVKARVLNTLLGGFFKSRLMQNLREDKGYTYGAGSSLSSDEEVGYFSANASVRNEVTDSAIVQFMYELERVRSEKVSEDELTLVKNYLFGSFARSLENPQTVARFALNTSLYNLPADYYETYLERLANVTAEDVMAMAQKYIKPENAHVLVVGNKGEVAEKLAAIAPVKYFDVNGDPIVNDFTMPEGHTVNDVIKDYLTAIGGMDKLKSVKSLSTVMIGNMMGQELTVELDMEDNRFSNVLKMGGMGEFQKQVYNNGKGVMTQMGQSVPIGDKELAEMKDQAQMFAELNYLGGDYKLKLGGVESIEGANAYVVEVEAPSGKKVTEYYSVDSGLKLRELEVAATGQTVIQDFADYQENSGIKYPGTITMTGVGPAPLKLSLKTLKINEDIDDAKFSLE